MLHLNFWISRWSHDCVKNKYFHIPTIRSSADPTADPTQVWQDEQSPMLYLLNLRVWAMVKSKDSGHNRPNFTETIHRSVLKIFLWPSSANIQHSTYEMFTGRIATSKYLKGDTPSDVDSTWHPRRADVYTRTHVPSKGDSWLANWIPSIHHVAHWRETQTGFARAVA